MDDIHPRATAAALRRREGVPETECLYEQGYESEECDCPTCWPEGDQAPLNDREWLAARREEIPNDRPGVTYPGELPPQVDYWHSYMQDSGHVVWAAVKVRLQDKGVSPDGDLTDHLNGMAVKTFLRHPWEVSPRGFLIADLPRELYHEVTGVDIPDEDEEW